MENLKGLPPVPGQGQMGFIDADLYTLWSLFQALDAYYGESSIIRSNPSIRHAWGSLLRAFEEEFNDHVTETGVIEAFTTVFFGQPDGD